MKKYPFPSLLLYPVTFFAIVAAHLLTYPPSATISAEKGELPANEFSTNRAMVHVREIAQKPHPVGSEENARIRDYLVEVMRDQMGLEVEELEGEMTRPAKGERPEKTFHLVNIFARLPGSETGPGLLLVAHHDSVSRGPGAADDTANIAAILEAVRTLKARGNLKRDLTILLTDGEEVGLLGAKLFVKEQAERLKEVALIFNFEARGVSGPSFMFESSGANAEMVAAFSKHAFHPIGNSLADYVYRQMPNNTDFTVFSNAGLAGFNFAFFDDAKHYHRATDNVDNLDPRSLQHVGKLVLGLCQYLGNVEELPATATESDGNSEVGAKNAIFFNLIGSVLIHYPIGFSAILSSLLLVLLVVSPVLSKRFGNEATESGWRVKPLIFGVIWGLGVILLTSTMGFLLILIARKGRWDLDTVYLGFWITLSVSILLALFVQMRWGKHSAQSAEVLVVAAGALLGFLLPEGSYLFQWSALFVAVSWVIESFGKIWLAQTIKLIALLVAVLIHTPTIYYIFIAFPPAAPVLIHLAVIDALLLAAIVSKTNTQILAQRSSN